MMVKKIMEAYWMSLEHGVALSSNYLETIV